MKTIEYSLQNIDKAAQKIISQLFDAGIQIVTFRGDLGAGKTTLIKSLVRNLGYQAVVSSPTFTYLNIYECPSGLIIYHFDLYRLSSLEQFEQLGFFEYLYQPNSIVFIEWPEIIESVLRLNICNIAISIISDQARIMNIECVTN